MLHLVKRGFTLVELLIVVAIVGLLASAAIPAYQNYITSTEFALSLDELQAFKQSLILNLNNTGTCLTSSAGTGAGAAAAPWAASRVYSGYATGQQAVGTPYPSCFVRAKYKATGVSSPLQNKVTSLVLTYSTELFTVACTSTVAANFLASGCTNVATITFP